MRPLRCGRPERAGHKQRVQEHKLYAGQVTGENRQIQELVVHAGWISGGHRSEAHLPDGYPAGADRRSYVKGFRRVSRQIGRGYA